MFRCNNSSTHNQLSAHRCTAERTRHFAEHFCYINHGEVEGIEALEEVEHERRSVQRIQEVDQNPTQRHGLGQAMKNGGSKGASKAEAWVEVLHKDTHVH